MQKATIKDFNFNNKKVFVRVDFNVPLKDKKITDDNRIEAALPTINYLLENGATLILASHLGDPKTEEDKELLNMEAVAQRLSELLGKKVLKAPSCIGKEVKDMVDNLKKGDVLLLENTRFHKGEKKNDPDFAKELASYADVCVNDAFGTAHRAHASNCGVAELLPCYAGFLMEKEIDMIGNTLENPKRPFIAILGGAKVSSKIGVIENLLTKVDTLLIGGAMVFTFARALGYETGNSLVEEDKIELASELIKKAKKAGKKLIFPVDFICADKIEENVKTKICPIQKIDKGLIGLDIGPESLKIFEKELINAKTVVWNGPMGVFEIDIFAKGTKKIANIMAKLKDARTIIGGGDSAAAVNQFGLESKMTHISTGGGASLEYMEGIELPGIKAIKDAQ
ncbi:MAG: phosphoglycerate kinase [Candidatus Muirbacterium halophilum]|nr:phosphoglycerate kinase [Candidatus Muirbacterium halophilum]MCK9475795.1 phosphoglycerate kinase [Candidatus Muirbacterium halophilum]